MQNIMAIFILKALKVFVMSIRDIIIKVSKNTYTFTVELHKSKGMSNILEYP